MKWNAGWPTNKDIPLFAGVPVIMNHRVFCIAYAVVKGLEWSERS